MNTQLGSNLRAVPPPAADRRRASAIHRAAPSASPTIFVAKVIYAAIAIVLAGTLMLIAPRVVTVPLVFVLLVGVLVSGLLVTGDGWRPRRSPRGIGGRRSISRDSAHSRPELESEDGRQPEGRAGRADWRVLASIAAVSVTLLLLALVTSESVGTVLGVSGLAGLVGLRLTAMHRGGMQHAPAQAAARCGPALAALDDTGRADGAGRSTGGEP